MSDVNDRECLDYETEMLQCAAEVEAFVSILREAEVRSFLEIGSKFGGLLWRVAQSLPHGSRLVVVDLPAGTRAWAQSRVSLVSCVERLSEFGHEAKIVWGDSTDQKTIDEVRRLAPFDAVFIDANHTSEYVRQDWANYGPMARIVAFHDIGWRRESDWKGMPIDVPAFWRVIKSSYRHREILLEPNGKDNGIGVLWRT